MSGYLENSEFRRQNRLHAANTRAFLQSGEITNFGQSKNYVQQELTFDALENILVDYGERLVRGMKEELDKADANASGKGDGSIRFELYKNGKTYETRVFMADYLKFVDLGVQGVGAASRNKTSPFKFRFINPSKKHVEALEQWIKTKNVRAIVTVPKGISADIKPRSLAYIMARSSKIYGLRATYFRKKTIDNLIDDLRKDIINAAGNDIKVNILYS
jgi:hypothetical protein